MFDGQDKSIADGLPEDGWTNGRTDRLANRQMNPVDGQADRGRLSDVPADGPAVHGLTNSG